LYRGIFGQLEQQQVVIIHLGLSLEGKERAFLEDEKEAMLVLESLIPRSK